MFRTLRQGGVGLRRWMFTPLARGLTIGLIAAVAAWGACFHPSLAALEMWAYDSCFVIRGTRHTECPVILIALDDASLLAIDKPISYMSPELAGIVKYLSDRGVASIAVDVLVPQEPETDQQLQAGERGDAEGLGIAVIESGRVVLPILDRSGLPVLQPVVQWRKKEELARDPAFGIQAADTDYGFVNLFPDRDRFVRRQTLVAGIGPERETRGNLAYAAFRVARRATDLEADRLVKQGLTETIINYVGPPGSIPQASFVEVLRAAESGDPQAEAELGIDWRGKIVIFGGTADYLGDQHPTPFANAVAITEAGLLFSVPPAREMSGPEIHANVIATLYDGADLRYPSQAQAFVLACLTGAVLGPLMVRGSLEGAFALMVLHHIAWRGLAIAAFVFGDRIVPIVPVLATGGMAFVIAFSIRWRWMRRTVGLFKSEAVARVVEADPSRMALRGESREVTVMFCDVREFTSFSESHPPQEVVRLLNEYFGRVVPIIEEGGGIVNQYVGDGLMVLFGAPMDQPDHAFRGVRVAVRMLRAVHANRDRFRELGAANFRIGIGLCSGDAVLGTVGSPKRLDYTAVGDTVNSAARVESATKDFGCELLIGESTYEKLTPAQRESLGVVWEDSREIHVKGKQEPIRVHSARI